MRASASASASRTPSSWPSVFNEAGYPGASSERPTTPRERTRRSPAATSDRRVNMLFTADLFNEGLDIPDVDTVLFLRPTESATVFLQQLGRGLRRTRQGCAHRPGLRGLSPQGVPLRRSGSARSPAAPGRGLSARSRRLPVPALGCQIVLDKQSQELVLENIRSQIANRWTRSWRSCELIRRPGPGDVPRRVWPRAQRHPSTRQPLMDRASP